METNVAYFDHHSNFYQKIPTSHFKLIFSMIISNQMFAF